MKIIATITFAFVLLFVAGPSSLNAQCVVVDSVNGTYGFNDPNGSGAYSGFLCSGVDSVGTTGASGYYDGDGYSIKLVAGTQVTFLVDSCVGNSVSLTVNDSTGNIIPGAYAGPACPNSLDFTATYTGEYIIVINLNGVCGGGGSSLIGEAHVRIQTGTTIPNCPDAGVLNDTICGAIPLHVDSAYVEGNTMIAYPTDPLDGYISSIGGSVCSPPNNTLWYSFTPANNVDTVYVVVTSEAGGGFHSWLVVFPANSIPDPCNGSLSFLGCAEGANDGAGIDTVKVAVFGLIGGHTYFFMIDGYNGSTGRFSIALESSGMFNGINEAASADLAIYPNPAGESFRIQSSVVGPAEIVVTNSTGQVVMHRYTTSPGNEEFETGSLADGIYSVSVHMKNFVLNRRLIVCH